MYNNQIIEWILEKCRENLTDLKSEDFEYKKAFLKEWSCLDEQLRERDSTYCDTLKLKYKARNLYKKISEFVLADSSISATENEMYSFYIGSYQKKKILENYYTRTSPRPIYQKILNNFIAEFIYPYTSFGYFQITNSGMSAFTVALLFSKYFYKLGKRIVMQSNLYYELYFNIDFVYNKYDILEFNQINLDLMNDESTHCIITGYFNDLNIYKFLDTLRKTNRKSFLFVIIDRTLFSVIDNYYQILSKDRIPTNVFLISVESLLKNHQYGLDMTNLGFITIYNRLINAKLLKGILQKMEQTIYNSPSEADLLATLPFNYYYSKQMFLKASANTKLIYQALKSKNSNKRYDIVLTAPKELYISNSLWYGNQIYIYESSGKISDKFNKLIQSSLFVNGQSFGFDITRISLCIDYFDKREMIRIAIGTEPIETVNKIIQVLEVVLFE